MNTRSPGWPEGSPRPGAEGNRADEATALTPESAEVDADPGGATGTARRPEPSSDGEDGEYGEYVPL